jgi:hypothetical protein
MSSNSASFPDGAQLQNRQAVWRPAHGFLPDTDVNVLRQQRGPMSHRGKASDDHELNAVFDESVGWTSRWAVTSSL